MFTGLIQCIGTVARVRGYRAFIDSGFAYNAVAIGDSIACDGVCLTVVEKGISGRALFGRFLSGRKRCWFAVELSPETLSRTACARWAQQENAPVNLEASLQAGDRLGGHLVSGHVDGLARIVSIAPDGEARILTLEAPEGLSRFIAEKGSVTLDGVSLTVNGVEGARFNLTVIPHTWRATTLGLRQPGDMLNMEVDMIARYLARLTEKT
ncbi:MAG: riboflavin synthase [Alphaproteobacteria bacterium]|nr:riboflavin synthase [Alphaproteobacteria bacterium]